MTYELDERQTEALGIDRVYVSGPHGSGKSRVCTARWLSDAELYGAHRTLYLLGSPAVARRLADELPWRLDSTASLDVPVHSWGRFCVWFAHRYYRLAGFTQRPRIVSGASARAGVGAVVAATGPDRWRDHADVFDSAPFIGAVERLYAASGKTTKPPLELPDIDVAWALDTIQKGFHSASLIHFDHLARVVHTALQESDELAERMRKRFASVVADDLDVLNDYEISVLNLVNPSRLLVAGTLVRPAELELDEVSLDRVYRVDGAGFRPVERLSVAAGGVEAVGGPTRINVAEFAGESAEAEVVVSTLLAAAGRGTAWAQMAVIGPRPSALSSVRATLQAAGIPHTSGRRPLNAEPLVCWLSQLFSKEGDPAYDLVDLLASPLVGVSLHEAREAARDAFRVGEALEGHARARFPAYDRLRSLAESVWDKPADEAFSRIWKDSEWAAQILAARATDDSAARQVDVASAVSRALRSWVEANPAGTLPAWVSSDGPSELIRIDPPRGGHVELLTPREVVGREWEVVCVVGVNEGSLPDPRRATPVFDAWPEEDDPIASERSTAVRVFSRFTNQMLVTSCSGVNRARPSRFINEGFHDAEPPDSYSRPSVRFLRAELGKGTEQHRRAAASVLALHTDNDPSTWHWQHDFTPAHPLTDGKLTTSYSRIGIYDECPLRYVLQSVLGLDPVTTFHMRFGSLIHKIFEEADPAKDNIKTLDEAKRIFDEAFTQGGHTNDYPNRKYATVFWKAGRRMIHNWWMLEREVPGRTPVAVEFVFNDLDIDGHTIRGRIDRIEKGPRGLILSDYKTSNSLPTVPQVQESLQLAIYYEAARRYPELLEHGEPAEMALVFPAKLRNPRDGGEPTLQRRSQYPEHAERNLETLRDALEGAAAEVFDPKADADCRWCRVKNLCPRWPQGREIPM